MVKGHSAFKSRSTKRCKICGGKYNKLIHDIQHVKMKIKRIKQHLIKKTMLCPQQNLKNRIYLRIKHGVRALLDTGVQKSFETKKCAEKIHLKANYDKDFWRGIGAEVTKSNKSDI